MTVPHEQSPAARLAAPAQFLRGAGPERAEALARLGLHRVADVLFFFPRDYQDASRVQPLAQLREGEPASICGTVEEVDMRTSAAGRTIVGVLVRQGVSYLRALWFNQPFMQERFALGQKVLLSGTPKLRGLRWEMAHPRVEYLDPEDDDPQGQILPIYRLSEGISQPQMRKICQAAVEQYADALEEVFPEEYLDAHNLWPIHAALPEMHQPTDAESLARARRRFKYQELLVLQLALAMRRRRLTAGRRAAALPLSAKIDARIRRLFPFELTAGQQQAIAEVAADMGREFPMNRLLQGEVGSGKTVVAVYAMLLAVAHGRQAVLMAPTEVLARQHAQTLARMLREARVRLVLLLGGMAAAERRTALEAIAQGEADVIVGTQAIVQPEVQFARLGLVVIDEQHRFGVEQRARLRRAGLDPHYLVMTATPIPRTVGMTLYGDLDVSTLRDPPPGRQPVHTYLVEPARRGRWWEFFRKKLAQGRQGYVIVPLVEDSAQWDAASLDAAFERLANDELEAFRLDLVHGRLPGEAKAAAIDRFRSGKTQVLVATSVVEVGIDVPNATVMTIEGAERFGLAQLHQLRGRVSRGAQPGFVGLFAEPKSAEAQERLDAFVRTRDGFELAEIDFRLRGPGDLLGTRQHGLPPLRVADLREDADLLDEARRDAQQLIAADPDLADPRFALLRRQVLRRYGAALELGDVG